MKQREAFESWIDMQMSGAYPTARQWAWQAWQAATRHAAQLALVAPVKTARQDQREACANWILGGME